jgi:hypothetical protein
MITHVVHPTDLSPKHAIRLPTTPADELGSDLKEQSPHHRLLDIDNISCKPMDAPVLANRPAVETLGDHEHCTRRDSTALLLGSEFKSFSPQAHKESPPPAPLVQKATEGRHSSVELGK